MPKTGGLAEAFARASLPGSSLRPPSPPKKRARSSLTEVGTVPAVVDRTKKSTKAQVPLPPELPAAECLTVDVLTVMRSVIAYVKLALRNQLRDDPNLSASFADIELHQHRPLDIRLSNGDHDLLNFTAPWLLASAKIALSTTGLYQASGNLFWTNPFPVDGGGAQLANNPCIGN